MKLGFKFTIISWISPAVISASLIISPIYAQEFPTLDQTYRKDMGEPRFDSNAVTRYQVNETNGNLYLYHHLMTLPNQKGLPLNISLTYNSKNSDAPHLLGKACWSLSLEKRLDVKEHYLVEDPGDWEEVESGDLLSESPEVDFQDITDGIGSLISGAEQNLQGLKDNQTELQTSQKQIEEQIRALDEFYSNTGPDNLIKMQDSLDTLVNETIPAADGELQLYEGMEDQWMILNAAPNCERDGWDDYPGCYMPDEDWAIYQSLGGNDGFIYDGELDDISFQVGELNDARTKLEDDIGDLESQISDTPGQISDLQGDWDTIDDQLRELDPQITEADKYLAELQESQEYFNSNNFKDIQYASVDGATLIDGEGDGFFILEGYYEPESNALHVAIDTEGSEKSVTFKDGRKYVFDANGNIIAAMDRYGNTNSYYYTLVSSNNWLSAVQDSVGRRVEITYTEDRISAITIKYGDQTRIFTLGYDDEDNLDSITNPEDQTTQFVYMTPEMYQVPGVIRVEPYKVSRHLLLQVIDAKDNTINFEYSDLASSCTRIWKGIAESHVRECKYDWLGGQKDGEHPNVLVTDSNGRTHTKYLTEFELDAPKGRMERTMVTRIDDPYGKSTRYEFDDYYFNLTKTTDTNELEHGMEYDEMGNLVKKIIDPDGKAHEATFTYETMFNQVIASADFNGHVKSYYYVADGSPAGYGPDGVMWKEVDAEGNETEHWYNQSGQRIKTEDPRGYITEFEYDNAWGYLSRIRKYTTYPSAYYDKTFTYDWLGNKQSETDLNGNLTEYSYDVMNRLTGETVNDGEEEFTTSYYYDVVGNQTGMVNPRGVITQYGYDDYDRLITVTEALGLTEERTKHYGYDTEDNKSSETDFNGHTATFTYDALNRLKKKVEPAGTLGNKVTVYYYEGNGDSSTNEGTSKYDRSKDRYTRMVQNNASYRGEAKWLTTYYSYDLLYRLEKITDPKNCEKEFYYDPVGNKLWEEDANNHRTDFEYDKDNRLKKTIDPYTAYVEYWYDASGNKYRERDKNGHDTYFEYDALNRLTKTTDAENGEAHALYDGMNKVAERDKNGNWTAFSYNGRNLLTETHFAISAIVSYADYDEAGNRVSETDPNGNVTHYIYDGLNRMTSKIQAYGALDLETEYGYDDNGNRTSIEDAEDHTTSYEYDALNRLIKVIDPVNGSANPTRYDYDLLGNKVRTTDAKWHPTEYFYDDLSRLVNTKNALGQVTATYGYDCVGNRISQIDGKEQEIEYQYDDLNRLKLRTFVGDSSWVEYSYDPTGNRIWMEDSTGETSYTYDDVNRLQSVSSPGPAGNNTVAYTYYANGERETMTDPDDGVTSYIYDDLNRLKRIVDPDDGETEYDYDYGSRFTAMTYPNGTVAHYDVYDQANRLVHLKTTDSTGNTTFTSFTYDYDKVGNRTDMIEAGGTTHYDYDALYRLTFVSYPASPSVSYYYDAVGNRDYEICNGVTKDYNYNVLNQLISWSSGGTGTPTKLINVTGWVADSDLEMVTVNGVLASLNQQTFTAEGVEITFGTNTLTATAWDSASNVSQHQINVSYQPNLASFVEYSYDANGCLQGKTVDGSAVTTYEYDFENRLTKVTLPTSLTNEFTYDGDKRRVASKNSAGTQTWYLFDGLNVLQDLVTDGTPWASYVQGIGIDKLISRKSSGNRVYYHCDAIGSVRSLTNDAEFSVGTYVYDAWGKVTLETGTSGNDYKFTSREWEGEIGLQFNRARFYDPETGRFTTPDPLTGGPDDPRISYFSGVYSQFHRFIKEYVDALQPDKLNRYVYCYNNPANLIDPLGLQVAEEQAVKVQDEAEIEKVGGKVDTIGQDQDTGTEQRGESADQVKQREGSGKNANSIGKAAEREKKNPEVPKWLQSGIDAIKNTPGWEDIGKQLQSLADNKHIHITEECVDPYCRGGAITLPRNLYADEDGSQSQMQLILLAKDLIHEITHVQQSGISILISAITSAFGKDANDRDAYQNSTYYLKDLKAASTDPDTVREIERIIKINNDIGTEISGYDIR